MMTQLSSGERSRKSLKYVLFLVGIAFVSLAWSESYPVSIPRTGTYVFDKISPWLWLGLSLIFVSLYEISRVSNRKIGFLCAITFTLFVYVHYLLFPLLPGSDSHYFRALTKLFSSVGINPTEQDYFQWPSFFILNKTLVEVLALDVNAVSLVTFLLTGFLLSSTLFVFLSSEDRKLGFIGVAFYFMGLFYFLNYQFAPQSLALGLFLVSASFMSKNAFGFRLASFLIFGSLVLMHAFIPVLFLLCYLILTFRDPRRVTSLILFCAIYLATLTYFSVQHFQYLLLGALAELRYAFTLHGEYAVIIQGTFVPPVTFLDAVAQTFSRAITISIWAILIIGCLMRALNKDIKITSLSLLIAGSIYFAIGTFLSVLGARALQIVFVPFVSGYKPLLRRAPRIMHVCLLLIFMLFPFVIMHQIYDTTFAQTTSGQRESEILIGNLRAPGTHILSSDHDGFYIFGNLPMASRIQVDNPRIVSRESLWSQRYDYVIYGPPLEKEEVYGLGLTGIEIAQFRDHLLARYDRIFDDGYNSILSSHPQ